MITLRFRFAKYGAMKYLGHLDLLRYFQKAVRRAEIPVAYSTGFSPHQIMSFAMPLSVGLTSEGEYFDVGLEAAAATAAGSFAPGNASAENENRGSEDAGRSADLTGIFSGSSSIGETGASLIASAAPGFKTAAAYRAALQETMVDGIEVLSAGYLPEGGKKAMAQVAAAGYIIYYKNLCPDKSPKDIAGIFKNAPTITVTKKTKRGEREIDLKQLVYRFETGIFSDSFFKEHPCLDRNTDFAMADGDPYFYALVNASSGDNIRPEFLMKALTGTDFEADGYLDLGVHRTELYTGTAEDGFISLAEGGLDEA